MVRLNKGENTISFVNEYGYMAIDTVTVSEAVFPDLSIADDTPVDKNATPETKALMKYLKSVYGMVFFPDSRRSTAAVIL